MYQIIPSRLTAILSITIGGMPALYWDGQQGHLGEVVSSLWDYEENDVNIYYVKFKALPQGIDLWQKATNVSLPNNFKLKFQRKLTYAELYDIAAEHTHAAPRTGAMPRTPAPNAWAPWATPTPVADTALRGFMGIDARDDARERAVTAYGQAMAQNAIPTPPPMIVDPGLVGLWMTLNPRLRTWGEERVTNEAQLLLNQGVPVTQVAERLLEQARAEIDVERDEPAQAYTHPGPGPVPPEGPFALTLGPTGMPIINLARLGDWMLAYPVLNTWTHDRIARDAERLLRTGRDLEQIPRILAIQAANEAPNDTTAAITIEEIRAWRIAFPTLRMWTAGRIETTGNRLLQEGTARDRVPVIIAERIELERTANPQTPDAADITYDDMAEWHRNYPVLGQLTREQIRGRAQNLFNGGATMDNVALMIADQLRYEEVDNAATATAATPVPGPEINRIERATDLQPLRYFGTTPTPPVDPNWPDEEVISLWENSHESLEGVDHQDIRNLARHYLNLGVAREYVIDMILSHIENELEWPEEVEEVEEAEPAEPAEGRDTEIPPYQRALGEILANTGDAPVMRMFSPGRRQGLTYRANPDHAIDALTYLQRGAPNTEAPPTPEDD